MKRNARPAPFTGCPDCHRKATFVSATDVGQAKGNLVESKYLCRTPECATSEFTITRLVRL